MSYINILNNKNRFIFKCFGILLIFLWIPTVIILMFGGKNNENVYSAKSSGKSVIIDGVGGAGTYELDVEEYIVCAVAAQMSPEEEEELLKAFAIIIRTHISRLMGDKTTINASEINLPYVSYNDMQNSWKKNFTAYYNKLNKSVSDTYMQVVMCNGELIVPYFHSLSSGATRNGNEVAAIGDVPYLKSVTSKDDIVNEKYLSMKTFEYSEFAQMLKKYRESIIISPENPLEVVSIVERDSAGYVKNIQVGSTLLTGDEFMECFSLASPNFVVEEYDGKVRVTTKGNGHGLGLSINGAKHMAYGGKSYKEILMYYYTDIEVEAYGS